MTLKTLSAKAATALDQELMSTCAFSLDQLMELAGLSVSQAGASEPPSSDIRLSCNSCQPPARARQVPVPWNQMPACAVTIARWPHCTFSPSLVAGARGGGAAARHLRLHRPLFPLLCRPSTKSSRCPVPLRAPSRQLVAQKTDDPFAAARLTTSAPVFRVHPPAKGRRVLVACGPGNNGECADPSACCWSGRACEVGNGQFLAHAPGAGIGGDGLVAARHLRHYGYQPAIYYPKRGKNDLYQRLTKQLEDLEVPFVDDFPTALKSSDHVIDAIFGFSFSGEVRHAGRRQEVWARATRVRRHRPGRGAWACGPEALNALHRHRPPCRSRRHHHFVSIGLPQLLAATSCTPR
ncbi:hypothetical protein RB599_002294 [Gaeumannomyces hyphopodioides]